MYQNKILILSIALLFGCHSTEPVAQERDNESNYVMVVTELTEKLAQLSDAITQCEERAKKSISFEQVKACGLSKSANEGLLHLENVQYINCSKSLQQEVLPLLVLERNMRNQYKVRETKMRGISAETLNMFDQWSKTLPIVSPQSYEAKQMFKKIPEPQQDKLLNCQVLQRPFDVLSVSDLVKQL
ncbi:hypothetical protein [Flocculibacter collagenilyticus]|uniref:hypothetical protein n=1 Tax=Flocculibacter collagenilyticus TaxID=2744479 RepID=UPI0018F49D7A|nr:hypothetical protein [Flocculibacter collagenilyticus]